MQLNIWEVLKVGLVVLFLLPVTLIYGFMASLGIYIGGDSIARKIINGEMAYIGFIETWIFLTGFGGLIGLIGFWSYFIWRIRLLGRVRASARVIPLLLLIGVISAVSFLLPSGLEGLLENTLFTAALMLMAVIGLYAAVDMLKPNKRLQSDAASPRA